MLKNYLKTAVRNLLREKGNASINIAGLTLGITGSIVLFLMVKHGASFDNYHINHDQIYRVVSKSKGNNGYNFTQGTEGQTREGRGHCQRKVILLSLLAGPTAQ